MSIASGGACTRSIFSRIANTAPVISSMVSPRTRSAISKPPICEGVASPDIIRSKPRAASSRVNDAPEAALAIRALKSSVTSNPFAPSTRRAPRTSRPAGGAAAGRGVPGRRDIEKILQNEMSVLGGDALGMELHAVHRQPGMGDAHHQFVVGLRDDRKLGRHGRALDH